MGGGIVAESVLALFYDWRTSHVYSSSWVMVATKKMRQIEGYWKLMLLTATLCD